MTSVLDDSNKNVMQRIKAQPKLKDSIATVPSIPNKTQIFFIPEGDDQDDDSVE